MKPQLHVADVLAGSLEEHVSNRQPKYSLDEILAATPGLELAVQPVAKPKSFTDDIVVAYRQFDPGFEYSRASVSKTRRICSICGDPGCPLGREYW